MPMLVFERENMKKIAYDDYDTIFFFKMKQILFFKNKANNNNIQKSFITNSNNPTC